MLEATATLYDPGSHKGSDTVDLTAVHDFAVDVALQAGSLIRTAGRERSRRARTEKQSIITEVAREKDSQVDLVTAVDTLVEEYIHKRISTTWPTHEIVAEESYGRHANTNSGWEKERGPTWFIDPLDGTLNFTHLFPLFCISIGFSMTHVTNGRTVKDDPLVGVIYAPCMGASGTLWSAVRGRGAYLSYPAVIPKSLDAYTDHLCCLRNLEEAHVRQESVQKLPLVEQALPLDAPSGILFASEWGKDRQLGQHNEGNLGRKIQTMSNMAANDGKYSDGKELNRYVHGVRSLGSSALDLAFVAQGSVDVLWEGGCWEWDVCAGIAILLEAGGLITDSNPPPSDSEFWQEKRRLPRAELGGRRFLAVRSASSTDGESSVEAQERVVKQVWRRSGGLNYRRTGVTYPFENRKHFDSQHTADAPKSASSVRNWSDPLRERKRLTKEEAEQLNASDLSITNSDTFGGRILDEDKDQWSHNAWDHVEPPDSYMAMVEDKLQQQAQTRLTHAEAAGYNATPASFWDSFYSQHENRFFKDRRWLHLEFPELIRTSREDSPPTRILEVGCGAGNTVFPLLECNRNPNLEIFACDYSPEAVNVVKGNPLYTQPPCGRCFASVWDLASCTEVGSPNPPEQISPHSLDIVVLIFVLSALHPTEWTKAMNNVRHVLKPGGLVLVRDYGRYDLPQIRFGKHRMMEDNLYVRGDGTRVYFFTPEEFITIFNATPSPGPGEEYNKLSEETDKAFQTLQLAVDRRMLLNRKERKQMYRNWLQAKFRLLS